LNRAIRAPQIRSKRIRMLPHKLDNCLYMKSLRKKIEQVERLDAISVLYQNAQITRQR
jgi:hypothetical protein